MEDGASEDNVLRHYAHDDDEAFCEAQEENAQNIAQFSQEQQPHPAPALSTPAHESQLTSPAEEAGEYEDGQYDDVYETTQYADTADVGLDQKGSFLPADEPDEEDESLAANEADEHLDTEDAAAGGDDATPFADSLEYEDFEESLGCDEGVSYQMSSEMGPLPPTNEVAEHLEPASLLPPSDSTYPTDSSETNDLAEGQVDDAPVAPESIEDYGEYTEDDTVPASTSYGVQEGAIEVEAFEEAGGVDEVLDMGGDGGEGDVETLEDATEEPTQAVMPEVATYEEHHEEEDVKNDLEEESYEEEGADQDLAMVEMMGGDEEGRVEDSVNAVLSACVLEFEEGTYWMFSNLGGSYGVSNGEFIGNRVVFENSHKSQRSLAEGNLTSFIIDLKSAFGLANDVTIGFPQLGLTFSESSFHAGDFSLQRLSEYFESVRRAGHIPADSLFKVTLEVSDRAFSAQIEYLNSLLEGSESNANYLNDKAVTDLEMQGNFDEGYGNDANGMDEEYIGEDSADYEGEEGEYVLEYEQENAATVDEDSRGEKRKVVEEPFEVGGVNAEGLANGDSPIEKKSRLE
ncbi:hypothetical protein HDU67_008911 [Dinochytrium kinnereticum]|nr:hypothetical protein HDU67_008911 [Dinochytrium kinnereticum]